MRNLAHIGFEVKSLEEFQALAEMVCREGKAHRAGRTQYYQFTDRSGAELWAQVDENDEIAGMNAHFHGHTQVDARLLHAQAYEDRPLDGTFEAQPIEVDAGLPRDTPPPIFAFELPDARLVPNAVLPAEASLQLVAFAREAHNYPYLEDFHRVHPEKPLHRVQVMEGDRGEHPGLSSLVLIDGIVVEARLLQNLYTKRHFYWVLLKTAIGKIDLVASTRTMPALPDVGSIFDGQARLSGRVQLRHPQTAKPGLIERFFLGADANQRN